jgi:CRP-like cAMP-binding protein
MPRKRSGGCSLKAVSATSLEEARGLLRDCVLFRNLGPHERDALVARAHMRTFDAGDNIFLMGTQHDSMMAVLSGDVKISVPSADGKEVVLAVLHAGDVFGEIAMLDGKKRSADASALTACSLAILHRRDVLAALEHNPAAWLGLVEVLCRRLRRTDQHLVELALLQVPVRVAKALLRAVDGERAALPSNRASTDFHLSQRELGNMVGATRESVNKCLQEWQRFGVIRMRRGVISIADRAALEALAEQDEAPIF